LITYQVEKENTVEQIISSHMYGIIDVFAKTNLVVKSAYA